MKATLTINNKQVEAEINEEELRAALGESNGFKKGFGYWYVNCDNQVEVDKWADHAIDNARLKANNAFKTETEAYAEKMRRESMASRLDFVPEEGEEVWLWSYQPNVPHNMRFLKVHIPDWNIGCVKRTKKECEGWKFLDSLLFPKV